MSNPDLILLHAPSVYDFRKEAILYGPVSDLVPSTPVFEMYPIGFTTMAEYLERAGLQTRIMPTARLRLHAWSSACTRTAQSSLAAFRPPISIPS